ncbi:hypothetical protein HF086_017257 [Spodoptera exigua]|uniref:Peptidase aspartic putative domain-containing protein n=1 Tax=Spodoptera exigua TaxID=7107 RepID=A0A922MVP8_SPOEX|nr:hypothetical protein HF086_017257 [Spodoptera exigua]
MPTLDCLKKFLKNRADLLETLEEAKINNNISKTESQVGHNTKSFTKHHTPKEPTCSICKQHHLLFSCERFRQMSIEQRIKEVEKSKVCSNCLHPGHDYKSCRGGACKYCNKKHNTLLHLEAPKSSSVTLTSYTQSKTVLLSTAQVNILDKHGKPHTARALLDNGSTSSYITRKLCSKLGLPIHTIDATVTSINNQCTNITENTNIQIHSPHNKNYSTNTLCLIINQISNSVPHTYIHRNTIQIPSCIQLADPDFNIPAPIDLLLGADIFWQVMGTGKIPLGKQQPVLQETELGWLISGCISDIQTQNTNQNSSFFVNQISDNMNRFWELENISTPSDISQIAQQTCEEIFTSTTTRKDDGRFVVTIPFKQSPECLGQKWQSNDLEILQKANLLSNSLHSTINLGTKEPSKTLGIYWNTNQDTITYSTNIENSVSDNITKRKILSIIGQIFDPLGLISPSVLEAKIIMQKMWSLNLQWDNHVPHDIEVLWKKFIQSLSALKQLVIPRRVFYDSSKHIQLHIFCDASQNAYGGCVYVRSHTTKMRCMYNY